MTTHHLPFTKPTLLKLTPPLKPEGKKGGVYDTYYDTKENGLVLLVSNGGAKTFYLYIKVHGRPERIRLGSFPTMSVEQARKEAVAKRVLVNAGKNPNEEKKKMRAEITFGGMFEQFMERYSRPHKRSWRYDEREVAKFLSHWFKRKASQISKQDVQRLHEQVYRENGLYQANRILERMRAIYNKAIEWGWEGVNPTLGIKKYKEQSRDRFLQKDELPRFWAALAQEENEVARDYIILSLLTGARKANMLAMRWGEINWDRAEWRIPETKNGDPQTIPLSAKALGILRARLEGKDSEWVFPSQTSASGHLADPKKAWKRVLERAGITNLRIHDLRRTLGSWQAITGATTAVIGKTLGHKSVQATKVYERLSNDPVREAMERAVEGMMGE